MPSTPPPPTPPPGGLRLDDLAAAAGVPTSTIRLYRQRGLLPPPMLVGRTGYFDDGHVARLRLIARLQDQGFSLASISTLLRSWEEGRDVREVVGIEVQLDELLHDRASIELPLAELVARFPEDSLSPDLVARAVDLGLVELLADGRVRVPDRRFLEVGSDLAGLGVPLGVVLDEWARLRAETTLVAERFVGVFETHVLPQGWRRGLGPDRVAALADALARLRRDAGQVVLAALDAAIADAAAERLGELVERD